MSKKFDQYTAGLFITIFAATCWGFSGTCSEFMFKTRGVSSEWLTMCRMLTAGFLLLLVARLQGHGRKVVEIVRSPDIKRLILFAIVGLMTCQYTYLAAISFTNSGTATVLQYTSPAIVLAWSCLIKKKAPQKIEGFAMIFVMFGVFLLATHGNPSTLVISKEGLFWGLISAVSYALYMVLPGNLLEQYGATIVTGWGLIIGGCVFTLFIRPFDEVIVWDAGMFFGLFGLIIIGTAMSFSIYLYGVNLIGPVRASMLACIEPVSAALFSHFWLGTPFSFLDILGFAIILGAILLLSAPTPTPPKRLLPDKKRISR